MCGRKFVWRQGTKYVVRLQKYWVTSKTVGSQHFPEALHVFPASQRNSVRFAESKEGIPERIFLHGGKNPFSRSRSGTSAVEQEARNNLSRDGRFGGQTQNVTRY